MGGRGGGGGKEEIRRGRKGVEEKRCVFVCRKSYTVSHKF